MFHDARFSWPPCLKLWPISFLPFYFASPLWLPENWRKTKLTSTWSPPAVKADISLLPRLHCTWLLAQFPNVFTDFPLKGVFYLFPHLYLIGKTIPISVFLKDTLNDRSSRLTTCAQKDSTLKLGFMTFRQGQTLKLCRSRPLAGWYILLQWEDLICPPRAVLPPGYFSGKTVVPRDSFRKGFWSRITWFAACSVHRAIECPGHSPYPGTKSMVDW